VFPQGCIFLVKLFFTTRHNAFPVVLAVDLLLNIIGVVVEVSVVRLSSILQKSSGTVVVAVFNFFNGSIKGSLVEFLNLNVLFNSFQVTLSNSFYFVSSDGFSRSLVLGGSTKVLKVKFAKLGLVICILQCPRKSICHNCEAKVVVLAEVHEDICLKLRPTRARCQLVKAGSEVFLAILVLDKRSLVVELGKVIAPVFVSLSLPMCQLQIVESSRASKGAFTPLEPLGSSLVVLRAYSLSFLFGLFLYLLLALAYWSIPLNPRHGVLQTSTVRKLAWHNLWPHLLVR